MNISKSYLRIAEKELNLKDHRIRRLLQLQSVHVY